MFLRTAIAACAAATLISAPSFAEAPTAPSCAETSFRVYFAPGSASLDAEAARMLDIAARNVAECPYTEFRVAVDASTPLAGRRANAIAAAARQRDFDAVRVGAAPMTQRVSQAASPDYAQVVMSPYASIGPDTPLSTTADIGV